MHERKAIKTFLVEPEDSWRRRQLLRFCDYLDREKGVDVFKLEHEEQLQFVVANLPSRLRADQLQPRDLGNLNPQRNAEVIRNELVQQRYDI